MAKRILGIVGGMGPEATADLYREILRLTPASRDQDHIPVLIYSNPQIPERTSAILEGGEDPLPYLVETAQTLERAGAGALVMPCNTAHYFLAPLQEKTGIPILNMLEETAAAFRKGFPGGTKVGLLAATGTVRSGIYAAVFGRGGIEVLVPDDAEQKTVHAGIHRIKAAAHDDATARAFEAAGAGLVAAGAQAVILGCTEIPLAFDAGRAGYPVLNPTRILAQAAVDWALGRRA